jgi:hypothetical protein
MTESDRGHATAFTVEQGPERVRTGVLDVPAWWTGELEGSFDELGAEFTYRHPPQHTSVQRVVELGPERITWEVTGSHLAGLSDPEEWTGSTIVFDLVPTESGTEVRFQHVGLVPEVECYARCSAGWRHYVDGSLRSLLTTGAGLPDPW